VAKIVGAFACGEVFEQPADRIPVSDGDSNFSPLSGVGVEC
jgi:hypothetical protein